MIYKILTNKHLIRATIASAGMIWGALTLSRDWFIALLLLLMGSIILIYAFEGVSNE